MASETEASPKLSQLLNGENQFFLSSLVDSFKDCWIIRGPTDLKGASVFSVHL